MDKLKDYLNKMYGLDAMSFGFVLISVLISLVAMVFARFGHAWDKGWTLTVYIPLVLCLFRCFSTNRNRRVKENDWFVDRLDSMFKKEPKIGYGENYRLEGVSAGEEKKKYKFFKCPACRQKIRVPKGKGRIEITCPRCANRFIKKT